MSETFSTTTPNTEPIDQDEVLRRVDALMLLDDEIMPYLSVERATLLPDGSKEINAIHSMRLAIMVYAYYRKYPTKNIDPYKAAIEAMLHDFPEGRANDVATLTATKEVLDKKTKDEAQALEELQAVLGPHWPELMETLHTYEEQLTPQSRAVRLADKLDPAYTHLKNGGLGLRALGVQSPGQMSGHDDRLSERFALHRQENPDLALILDELRRRVARSVYNGWEQTMIQFDE